MTELEQLLKQRDAHAGRILHLALQIAGIFLIPVLLAAGINQIFDIDLIYLFPVAFVVSWSAVVVLYRRVSKQVHQLDAQIKDLRSKEKEQNNNAPDASTK